MWTLITGLVSQLTSDAIQRSESQQAGAQTHSSLRTQLPFLNHLEEKKKANFKLCISSHRSPPTLPHNPPKKTRIQAQI